jgi:hypothetical protein
MPRKQGAPRYNPTARGKLRVNLLAGELFWSQWHGAPCACGKVNTH